MMWAIHIKVFFVDEHCVFQILYHNGVSGEVRHEDRSNTGVSHQSFCLCVTIPAHKCLAWKFQTEIYC